MLLISHRLAKSLFYHDLPKMQKTGVGRTQVRDCRGFRCVAGGELCGVSAASPYGESDRPLRYRPWIKSMQLVHFILFCRAVIGPGPS